MARQNIEKADRDAIRQIQLERLQATVNRAYRHVAFYRGQFDAAGLLPEDLHNLEDLQRLPFTSRADLLAHQPYGLFAVPLHDVLRLHPAAGAGGPIMVGYTRNDIATWARISARALASSGVHAEDVVMITLDYAQDAAATGAQSGAETLGASVIPCSGLSPRRQAEVMTNYRATVLAATPSQALLLGNAVRDFEPALKTLRTILIVGEVWSDELRRDIEMLLEAEAFGSYGLSEMTVPGLATECERHNGLHLSEDNVIAEVINPETGEVLPHGEKGELVLTTLTREAVPLLRYRTGDLTVLEDAPCPCGRTLARMAPTHARADDVVIVRGIRVWPDQVEEIVSHFMPGSACRLDVEQDDDGRDQLQVYITLDQTRFDDKIGGLQSLRDHVHMHVSENLGMPARIRFLEAERRNPPVL